MLMATKPIVAEYTQAKELKQQIKTLEMMLELKIASIKTYLGESEILYGLNGAEIVTYKQSKSRIIFDEKLFKAEHEKTYNKYCTEREGSRVLLLK